MTEKKNINIRVIQLDTSKSLEVTISALLRELGIPTNIKGYQYLKDAVTTVVYAPTMINAITKELYPHVARRHDTTASSVERAIRHAIECAWARGDLDTLYSFFGNTVSVDKGKPTNSQAISQIAEHIRLAM